jgi:AraC family transcriptional regulator
VKTIYKPSTLTIENSIFFIPTGRVATSRGRGWKGVTFDLHGIVSDIELDSPPSSDHHAVGYCIKGAGRFWQKRAGRIYENVMRAGIVGVAPAGDARSWRGTLPPSLRMRVPCSLVNDAAEQIGYGTGRSPEIIDVFHTRDLFIGQIAEIFIAELESPDHPAKSLIIESASYALAAHMLRKYDAFSRKESKLTGLGPRALSAVTSYVEDHACSSIALDELAAIANVSRFHFTRMFKLSTGVSPMTYVEQCRIRKAQELMKEGRWTLAEVGTAVGFSDQSHFARRFRRHHGCSPSHYAASVGGKRFRRPASLLRG